MSQREEKVLSLHKHGYTGFTAQYNVLTAYLIGNMWMFSIMSYTKL